MEGLNGRIELIQIPQSKPAPDAFGDEHYVGYYHLSFDFTEATTDTISLKSCNTLLPPLAPPCKGGEQEYCCILFENWYDLPSWLQSLKQRFEEAAS